MIKFSLCGGSCLMQEGGQLRNKSGRRQPTFWFVGRLT
jgi:hypothetical protein